MYILRNPASKLLISVAFVLFINFCSCGFAYKKHVKGKYYIIGVDTKDDLRLSYKISADDYIGKAPGYLLQYGFNDTFLVAKTQEDSYSVPVYYIINMTKDYDLAHEEVFRIGPLTEDEYNKIWKHKLKIQLRDVD
jgi:hypothetical protein